ncbi:MAG: potassium transporter TrkG [Anaerovoracaceae bacterium]
MVAAVTAAIAVYNWIFDGFAQIGQKLIDAFFQVVSIISTTGFMTDDYDVWPTFSKMMILMLFFIGGCSSSTGGGVKAVRVLIGLKLVRRGVSIKLHPNRIAPVTLNDRELSSDVVINVSNFIFTYVSILFLGTLLISADGHDFITNLSASASSLGNIGPGFNMVGPTMNYAFLSDFSKWVCSLLMITGRLELFTVLTLFSRHYWNSDKVS